MGSGRAERTTTTASSEPGLFGFGCVQVFITKALSSNREVIRRGVSEETDFVGRELGGAELAVGGGTTSFGVGFGFGGGFLECFILT
jgi:hypothetical protein